jgi:hypothetical protein
MASTAINKEKNIMTEIELIEMLDNEQIKQILNSSDEYIIADFSVFNAGAVVGIELANDLPAAIFDEYEEMLDGIIIYDRGRIESLLDNKLSEVLENNAYLFNANISGISVIKKLELAQIYLKLVSDL